MSAHGFSRALHEKKNMFLFINHVINEMCILSLVGWFIDEFLGQYS